MKIANYEDTPAQAVDEQGASGVSVRWVIAEEDHAPNFFMRVFHVEPGGYTPSHEHAWEHEVFILKGSGTVLKTGEDVPVTKGDVVFIPPGETHQFKNTGSDTFTFICLIPRPNGKA